MIRSWVLIATLALTWLGAARAQEAELDEPEQQPQQGEAVDNSAIQTARTHFRLAVESYKDGDFATARIEFRRAYKVAPNYRLLFNLGQVSQELRDYPAAERYYSHYLEQGGDRVDEERKQQVEQELEKVRARIATLLLTSNIDGAEVFVDDVASGTTPLTETLSISTGQRKITLRAAGYSPATQVVDAAGGEVVRLHLELMPAVEAPFTQLRPSELLPTSGGSSHVNALALTLAIGTVALAAGAGVFAYLAARDASDYRSALERSTTASELTALSDGAKTKALITDVLLGATVVSAAAFVIVLAQQGMTQQDSAELRVLPGRLALSAHF